MLSCTCKLQSMQSSKWSGLPHHFKHICQFPWCPLLSCHCFSLPLKCLQIETSRPESDTFSAHKELLDESHAHSDWHFPKHRPKEQVPCLTHPFCSPVLPRQPIIVGCVVEDLHHTFPPWRERAERPVHAWNNLQALQPTWLPLSCHYDMLLRRADETLCLILQTVEWIWLIVMSQLAAKSPDCMECHLLSCPATKAGQGWTQGHKGYNLPNLHQMDAS